MGWLTELFVPKPEEAPGKVTTLERLVEPSNGRDALKFLHTWTCSCGAALRIRCRVDRHEGPSNFVVWPVESDDPKYGHSMIPAMALNWNGLAEERGWRTNPIQCPNCQAKEMA